MNYYTELSKKEQLSVQLNLLSSCIKNPKPIFLEVQKDLRCSNCFNHQKHCLCQIQKF